MYKLEINLNKGTIKREFKNYKQLIEFKNNVLKLLKDDIQTIVYTNLQDQCFLFYSIFTS